jgi:hypothetical protein
MRGIGSKTPILLLRMLVVRQVKVLAVEAADSVVEAVMTSEEVEVTSVVSQENLLNGGAQAGAQAQGVHTGDS